MFALRQVARTAYRTPALNTRVVGGLRRYSDDMPNIDAQAVGNQKLELEAMKQGNFDLWNRTTLQGPFGTKEAPSIVTSVNESRAVGCLGPAEGESVHELAWMLLSKGETRSCGMCGQVFFMPN
eukprot:GFYU01007775.1.p1 GENE.GFYU01007775.1~~GFYU01007775.1.p1  ORF type:complete len:124 (-),score=21.20 GFYU01007775.1:209-580(-)